jgi:hypothetical protein
MRRQITRLLLVALIGGTAFSLIRRRRRRVAEPAQPAPESAWPPIRTATFAPDAGWLPPDEAGACPISHPIKAKDSSHIFHVPGGRFYDRTKAERCYAEADHAERDGYRQAKA